MSSGTRLADFDIDYRLGKGAYGVVHRVSEHHCYCPLPLLLSLLAARAGAMRCLWCDGRGGDEYVCVCGWCGQAKRKQDGKLYVIKTIPIGELGEEVREGHKRQGGRGRQGLSKGPYARPGTCIHVGLAAFVV